MKRFLVKLIGLCLSVVLTVIGIAMVVLLVIPPQFQDTAFSVIVRKYDLLCKSESPKVIIVGGSSGGFGIDRQLLEDKLGLPVCNMALAAGLGMPFSTNLIRDNLQEGDLVVLAYEYGHWSSLNENMQPEVIMAAVDGRPELLKYIEPTSLDKLLQYYPTYMFKKLNSFLVRPIQGSGVNCSDAYNESGDLIYSRPACTLSEPINVSVQIRSDWIDPAFVQYVNNFIELANSKGAQVVISCPPLLDEAVVSSSEEILQFEQTLDEQVDCPIISHVEDYIYSRELMFDTVYHCNERGMEKRTTQLANDLFTYFIGQQGKVPAEYLENESIRDKLMDLYRDCFGLLSEYTEFETVNLVRDWAYAKIPFSTSMKLSIYNDEIYSPDAGSFASNFLELTNQNRGGYYCGGTAYGLASIYRMLGYDSFALDLAIFDGGNVVDSHVVTLVDISSDNEPFWCVQDAFFNLCYTDSQGNPLSIYQLRKKLINGQVNDIITIQGNAWWKPEIEKSPDIGYPPFRQNPEFEPIYFNGAYFRQININIGDTQDLSYFYERDGYLPDSRMIFMYPYALYSIWDDSPEQQLKYNDLKEGLGLL